MMNDDDDDVVESRVMVYARVRPLLNDEMHSMRVVHVEDHERLKVTTDGSITEVAPGSKSYQMDRVFGPSSSQDEIYEAYEQNYFEPLFQGFNATAFAYGQTGTGKTYTMLGLSEEELSEEEISSSKNKWGLIPRAAQFVLRSRAQGGRIWQVLVQGRVLISPALQ